MGAFKCDKDRQNQENILSNILSHWDKGDFLPVLCVHLFIHSFHKYLSRCWLEHWRPHSSKRPGLDVFVHQSTEHNYFRKETLHKMFDI